MGRITIKTVAEHVGVSASTVSNAYNRPDQLSADLRDRVLAAAVELGYTGPDAAGRSLRSGRAGAVGILLAETLSYAFSDPYAIRFLAGLSEAIEQTDQSIVVLPPSPDAVQRAHLDALATLCIRTQHPAAAAAVARGIPIVGTAMTDDPADAWVAIDDHRAGQLIGGHLARLGHRRVTVLMDNGGRVGTVEESREPPAVEDPDSRMRLDGLRAAMPEAEFTISSGGYNCFEAGRVVAPHVLDRQDRPSAVVAISDVMALGFLDAMRTRGLQAGRDVSVAGFDDLPEAAAAGLTTVRQPIEEKGRLVGRLLLDPDATPRQIVLPIELMIRSSTGTARG